MKNKKQNKEYSALRKVRQLNKEKNTTHSNKLLNNNLICFKRNQLLAI